MADAPLISLRELNRATLARHFLLERASLDVVTAVERLAGLQAQWSPSPYIGLWSRLAGFGRDDLSEALLGRRLVKATLMRGTLHIVSAREHGAYVAATSEARIAAWHAAARETGLDVDRLRAEVVAYAGRQPRGLRELTDFLEERAPMVPDRRRHLVWQIVSAHGDLVHAPPSGLWGHYRAGPYVAARAWLGGGERPAPEVGLRFVVRRYLAAFGPASLADLGKWSGQPRIGRLRAALAELAENGTLVTFRDEAGRTLHDMRDAPRPPADLPAPARYLPKWDNVILGYEVAHRWRILPTKRAAEVVRRNGDTLATFLVDGGVAGTWTIARRRAEAILELAPFGRLAAGDRTALEGEGERLVRFVEPEAARHGVRIGPRG